MLFFPIYRFVPAKSQIHVVAALSLFGFVTFWIRHNQVSLFLMYFILWWSGAELARAYLARVPLTIILQRRSILYLTLFTILAAAPVWFARARHQALSFGIHPVLEFRHFLACLLFLVIGLLWARIRWVGFHFIFGAFARVAPISYALYVFHFPLAVNSSYLEAIKFVPLQLTGYVGITFLLAYLAEVPFQNWINRKTDFLVKSSNTVVVNDAASKPRCSRTPE